MSTTTKQSEYELELSGNPAPNWARGFLKTMLNSWIEATAHDGGLFHANFGRDWSRLPAYRRTLVSQSRLIYNFSRGYETFGDPRFANAAHLGLIALEKYFLLDGGGYRWSVSADGGEIDGERDAYGHAFCILALATAAEIFQRADLTRQALATWTHISHALANEHGGLIWRRVGMLAGEASSFSQNPHMHMLEALMMLCATDKTGIALRGARGILSFVESLDGFHSGKLIESHTKYWQPLPIEFGGIVNIGHMFEWAFLLSEWHALTGDSSALVQGYNFLKTGLDWGLDESGAVMTSFTPDGAIVDSKNGLWQQCEAIRALHRYRTAHGNASLQSTLDLTLGFYKRCYIDTDYGGAFAEPNDGIGSPRMHKGDLWKLDYHSVNMCLELLRAD